MLFNIDTSLNKSSGIYIITSSIDNRVYIGSSNNLRKRFREHVFRLKNNCHGSKHLQCFVNKYGIQALSFNLLEVCDRSEIIKREQSYLDAIKPFGKLGFNTSVSAAGGCLKTLSEETKIKIYNTRVKNGSWLPREGREEKRKEIYDNKLLKEKLDRALNKKPKKTRPPLTQMHKQNLSKSLMGNKNGLGHKLSKDTRNRISNANKDTRPILQFTKSGEFVKEWNNQYELYTSLGIDKRNLSAVLHGREKSHKGYGYKFKIHA